MRAAVLLLADARFPGGAHAHSAGMEQAIEDGLVVATADVAAWTRDVLDTTAATVGALAARACHLAGREADEGAWDLLDAEADARTASPAQRLVSRRLGRQLLRSAIRLWPATLLAHLAARWEGGPHRAVAFGAAVAVAGGVPADAALAEVQGALAMPVSAAVRLLGLDPMDGMAILAGLADAVDAVVTGAVAVAVEGGRLPGRAAPMQEVCAERHARRRGVLFAS